MNWGAEMNLIKFRKCVLILFALLFIQTLGLLCLDRADANELCRVVSKEIAGVTQFVSKRDDARLNSSDYDSLNAVVVAAGSTPSTLIVTKRLVLKGDCVVPETLEIQVAMGGVIAMADYNLVTAGILKISGEIEASKGKLTINGPFEGSVAHIFTGTHHIVFGHDVDVFPEWWGAKGDGINDDSIAVQKAVNAAKSRVIARPVVAYRLTSPITIVKGISLVGNPPVPYVGAVPGTRGNGSWFFLDHLGVGFAIMEPKSNNITGVVFEKIGTFRNQPKPSPGWKPINADWDFSIANADVTFNGCMLLNPTKGIRVNDTIGGGYGRLTINDLVGQPLTQGIEITNSFDTFRGVNIRFWPYWKDNDNIHNYCLNNLVAFKFCRCDNPMLQNIFTIFAKYGMQFSSSVNGVTQGALISNADIDRFGVNSIYVDSSAKGVNVSITNLKTQAEAGRESSVGVQNDGTNSILSFTSLRISELYTNALKDTSGTALIRVSGMQTNTWNRAGTGQAMISGTAGSRIYIDGPIIYTTQDQKPIIVNDIAVVSSDEWIPYAPVVTSTKGNVSAYTASAKAKHHNTQVFIIGEVVVTDNGTGSGALSVSLPIITDSNISALTGKNITTGKGLTGIVAGNRLQLVNSGDGSYPLRSGDRIVFNAMYSAPR